MKNKSVVMNILIIGSILLVILLLVVVFSLIRMILPEKKEEEKKEIIENYILEDIDNISFNFKKANTNFEITDGEELIIIQDYKDNKFHLNYKTKNNTITFEEDSFIINPQKKKYIIYIPKDYRGKITITNGFGEMSEVGITNDLYINNNAGSIVLKDSRNISLKDVSGNVVIENIEGIIEAQSSTGNIEINNITGVANIESITGDILLSNFNIIGDSKFENISGDIILKMYDNSLCVIDASNERGKNDIDEKVCNNILKMYTIEAKNVTGMIKIF